MLLVINYWESMLFQRGLQVKLKNASGKTTYLFLGFTHLRQLHFLHNGTPAHYSGVPLKYWNQKFIGRWMGKSKPIAQHSLPSELNLLDFLCMAIWSRWCINDDDDVDKLCHQKVEEWQTSRSVSETVDCVHKFIRH